MECLSLDSSCISVSLACCDVFACALLKPQCYINDAQIARATSPIHSRILYC